MKVIDSKIRRFYSIRSAGRDVRSIHKDRKIGTCIKFDRVSMMHLYSRSCLLSSYKAAGVHRPRFIYTSMPKLISRFYTKRSVLRKIRDYVAQYK